LSAYTFLNEYTFTYNNYFISNHLAPQTPQKIKNKNKKQKQKRNNGWVHRKFSSTIHNIHLYTTNTLYPILYPPPPAEKYSKQNEKTKQDNKNKNKRQMVFGCIYVSQ
jgi:hypothetical protein